MTHTNPDSEIEITFSSDLVQEYTAHKILVNHETMSYFLSKLTQKRETIAKRTLSTTWDLDDWSKEDSYIEKWKLELLASLSKYNWAFFLLEPDNLPNRKQS